MRCRISYPTPLLLHSLCLSSLWYVQVWATVLTVSEAPQRCLSVSLSQHHRRCACLSLPHLMPSPTLQVLLNRSTCSRWVSPWVSLPCCWDTACSSSSARQDSSAKPFQSHSIKKSSFRKSEATLLLYDCLFICNPDTRA